MARSRIEYICSECGYRTLKWMGKCPGCESWDCFEEKAASKKASADTGPVQPAVSITQALESAVPHRPTGVDEFDRVLGGGLVPGSVVLIGGDPGIGKSTLLLDAAGRVAKQKQRVLYVTGEESLSQIALRAGRLGSKSDDLMVLAETDLGVILKAAGEHSVGLVVVDSIQTVQADMDGTPGQVAHIREAASVLSRLAKQEGITVVLIGHVTKDGSIAGPKLIEHMVDVVLYFEGERGHSFRILRAVKNRFGSASELGVFEMTKSGLVEVPDPSALFLEERPEGAPGSVVLASAEGQRPVLVEIQALCADTGLATPRRTSLGVDGGRVSLLIAVLEKRVGHQIHGMDVYVNVAGGMRLDEPAVDLGVAAAVAGSFLGRPCYSDTVCFGEIGLTGELRGVARPEPRIAEAAKMGFRRCVMPVANVERITEKPEGFELDPAANLAEALEKILV